jgi:hypothetical protein
MAMRTCEASAGCRPACAKAAVLPGAASSWALVSLKIYPQWQYRIGSRSILMPPAYTASSANLPGNVRQHLGRI